MCRRLCDHECGHSPHPPAPLHPTQSAIPSHLLRYYNYVLSILMERPNKTIATVTKQVDILKDLVAARSGGGSGAGPSGVNADGAGPSGVAGAGAGGSGGAGVDGVEAPLLPAGVVVPSNEELTKYLRKASG